MAWYQRKKNMHCSTGTVAVVSLLTGSVVARFYEKAAIAQDIVNGTLLNVTDGMEPDIDDVPQLATDVKLGIVMTVALLVGFTQVK